MRIKEFKELYDFEPSYSYYDLEYHLSSNTFGYLKLYNDELYTLVKKLTDMAYPTEESRYDKKWLDFYVPLRRKSEIIVTPLSIVLYKDKFFLHLFPFHNLEIGEGREKIEKFYLELISQTIKFSKILKDAPDIIEKLLPYDLRRGKVLGKYILKKTLPSKKKRKILEMYKAYTKRMKRIYEISLEDYLNVASVCYKAVFGKKTEGLTKEEMYRRWADGRDCGMLEIKNKKSKEEFKEWLKFKSSCGGHPFEIVFGWFEHGIHLFPPTENEPFFKLRLGNYKYADMFLKMTLALMRKKIPFKASNLKDVLDYLVGETYFAVNYYDKHSIFYDGDEELFKHIEWEKPRIVKFK